MSHAEADNKNPKKDDTSCNLYLKDEESPSDNLIVPAELNTFLFHRIRVLKSENVNLRQEVDGAKEALEKLQRSLEKTGEERKRSSEVTEARIKELNERSKRQAAELEAFKETCEKLGEKLSSKEVELENSRLVNDKSTHDWLINHIDSTTMTEEDTSSIQRQLSEKEHQMQVLTEKLERTNEEHCETKNACVSLSREINRVKKDLETENMNLRREVNEAKQASIEITAAKFAELRESYEHQETELEAFREKCKKLEEELANGKAALEEELAVEKLALEEEMTRGKIALEEKLASKLVELENASKRKDGLSINSRDSTTMTEEGTTSVDDHLAERDERVRILTEKLQQTSAKLYETKNTCSYLRQEINKAQKLLSREVGENVTIASLSNRSSGWRGRAEQVQHLQQKVADLQSKLNEQDGSSSKVSSSSAFAVLSEQRNIDYLRNLERERRQQIEKAANDARLAEVELETTRKKLQAAKARIKVLENELNGTKTNLALLNEKRIHDDQLVEALNGQLRAVEEKYRERHRETRYQKEKAEETCRELREELSAVKMQVELLRKKLQERETELDNLRNGAEKNRSENYARPSQLPRVHQPFSPVESRPATPRVFQDPNEYVTLSIAAEAERQRLLELVTVLNRRLDKERTDTDQISELLRRERNKTAKLETRIQRLEMERVGMARVNTGLRAKCSKSFANSAITENPNSEKIQFKLELLEEECLALKARLATVQQDKATDLEIYKKMLEQARRTFQDAFRGKMSYSAGCHSNVTI